MQIISRAEWVAKYAAGYGPRDPRNLSRYLHHTVTRHLPVGASVAAEVAQMRAIESIGQTRFKAGISYTFIVFPSGRVYEGAGIGRVSAHTQGRNTTGAGLCFAGNYETNPMGIDAAAGMAELLVHGVRQGWWPSATITAYHGQLKSTACPGKYAIKAIPEIHAAAARLIDVGSRSSERTTPAGWTPAVLPELINARLMLAGIKIRGRRSDYDAAAVAEYQGGQVFPKLFPDGLWGPTTEGHYNWTVELQSALIRVGGFLARDGFYGPHTAFTVGRFQSGRGLVVDEQAGPVTCAALGIRSHP